MHNQKLWIRNSGLYILHNIPASRGAGVACATPCPPGPPYPPGGRVGYVTVDMALSKIYVERGALVVLRTKGMILNGNRKVRNGV